MSMTIRQTMESTTTTKITKTVTRLYGKDLSAYEHMDVDELLTHLTEEELERLSKECDPDDSLLPANERCSYFTDKRATGPLNRQRLLEFLEEQAKAEEDWPEAKPFESGAIRGKRWQPKQVVKKPEDQEDGILLDIGGGGEYERALSTASEAELVDLAAILGLHSMINQDQFYATVTKSPLGDGNRSARFESIVKATQPRAMPLVPDNDVDVDKTLSQVVDNDPEMTDLNWNNIKTISNEKFIRLFNGLKANTNLKKLSVASVALTDRPAKVLVEALEKNRGLKSVNVESNFLSPSVIVDLTRSLLSGQIVEEFRAANQKPTVLGVKAEMEIAKNVLANNKLLRLGLFFDVPDARVRVQAHLQRNNDNLRLRRHLGGNL